MENTVQQKVLVLNRLWQPVHTCTARRAVKLLCVGHAKVVQTSGEEKFLTHDFSSWLDYSTSHKSTEMIHSVSLALCVPEIIVLDLYDRMPRQQVKFNRQNVFLRDQYTCQYCRREFPEPNLNLDHVIPRDKGGPTNWENIVTSCIQCNSKKSNKLPRQARMFPLQEPTAPKWRPHYAARFRKAARDSWNEFLFPNRDKVNLGAA